MNYNTLKTAVLELLCTVPRSSSLILIERLRSEKGIEITLNALRMALLRYHRQGIIKRENDNRPFIYALSPKGAARLVWLKGLPQKPDDPVPLIAALRRTQ